MKIPSAGIVAASTLLLTLHFDSSYGASYSDIVYQDTIYPNSMITDQICQIRMPKMSHEGDETDGNVLAWQNDKVYFIGPVSTTDDRTKWRIKKLWGWTDSDRILVEISVPGSNPRLCMTSDRGKVGREITLQPCSKDMEIYQRFTFIQPNNKDRQQCIKRGGWLSTSCLTTTGDRYDYAVGNDYPFHARAIYNPNTSDNFSHGAQLLTYIQSYWRAGSAVFDRWVRSGDDRLILFYIHKKENQGFHISNCEY